MPKIRNIIIFIAIAAAFVLIYIFFIKSPSSDQTSLVSSGGVTPTSTNSSGAGAGAIGDNSSVAQSFLTLLLSVKTIKLDDSIFSNPAFIGLHDSSIVLIPDVTIGRPNPFAQFGTTSVSTPASTPVPIPTPSTPATTTPKSTKTKQ